MISAKSKILSYAYSAVLLTATAVGQKTKSLNTWENCMPQGKLQVDNILYLTNLATKVVTSWTII